MLHLDKLETDNLTETLLKTQAFLTKNKNLDTFTSKSVTKLRQINNYKIMIKPKPTQLNFLIVSTKSTIISNLHYMEPIDMQEKILREQIKNKDKSEANKHLYDKQQQIQNVQQKYEANIQSQTYNFPLKFFKNDQSLPKHVEKLSFDQQKEINRQLIEQLKAKQAETLNEWIRLQDKHQKTEKLINDLMEHLETEESETSTIDDFISTTTPMTEKKSKKPSLYKAKPIVIQKPEESSIDSIRKENKCLNKRNGIYRDEFNCSLFYICEETSSDLNQMHKFTCPEGLEFNMEMCICVSFS